MIDGTTCMRHRPAWLLAIAALSGLCTTGHAQQRGAAQAPTPLEPAVPINRALARNQSESFTLQLDAKQMAQVVVEQKGIDVIVRVESVQGRSLAEFDSPNGARGPENVPVVSLKGGSYTIVVQPLVQNRDVARGQFEIRLEAVRHATARELKAARIADGLQERGVAAVEEALALLKGSTSPLNRIRTRIRAAQLLRTIDAKQSRQLIADAAGEIRDFIGTPPEAGDEFSDYVELMNIRREALQMLGQMDADMAVEFMQSTRPPVEWNAGGGTDQELEIEATLASQIAAGSPERAARMAQSVLDRGYPYALINVITSLRGSSPALAARLFATAASKLQAQGAMESTEAANLAINLLRMAREPAPRNPGVAVTAPRDIPLLPDQQYRELFTSSLSAALAFQPAPGSGYSAEQAAAMTLLNHFKSVPAEVAQLAPGSAAAIDESIRRIQDAQNPQQRYYEEAASNKPVDEILAGIPKAPRDTRDYLYQQVAQRIAREGDPARARQIIASNIANPQIHRTALNLIYFEIISEAMNAGRLDKALRGITDMKVSRDRTNYIGSLASRAITTRGLKKPEVIEFLEGMLVLLEAAPESQGQQKTAALLQVANAFARAGSVRGFDVVEPLVARLNDLAAAAQELNGFGQQVYRDGELATQNGNAIVAIATPLGMALGSLALLDFDRAKKDAGRIHRHDIRTVVLLQIGQQAIKPDTPGTPTPVVLR
jgi:hypothetical protein